MKPQQHLPVSSSGDEMGQGHYYYKNEAQELAKDRLGQRTHPWPGHRPWGLQVLRGSIGSPTLRPGNGVSPFLMGFAAAAGP